MYLISRHLDKEGVLWVLLVFSPCKSPLFLFCRPGGWEITFLQMSGECVPRIQAPVWLSLMSSMVSVSPSLCLCSFSRSGEIAMKFTGVVLQFFKNLHVLTRKNFNIGFSFWKDNCSNSFCERKAEGTVMCT